MTQAHIPRLSHRWETKAREEGEGDEKVLVFVCSEAGAPRAQVQTCSGCGARVELKTAEKHRARWSSRGGLRPWVLDKVYNEVVAPCPCDRCEARRATFPNYAGLKVETTDEAETEGGSSAAASSEASA